MWGRTAQPGANRVIASFLHCLVSTVSADVQIAWQVAEMMAGTDPRGSGQGASPVTPR